MSISYHSNQLKLNTWNIISIELTPDLYTWTPVSYLAHAVVGQFDVTLVVQKDIVQFQISVHNACEHKTKLGRFW